MGNVLPALAAAIGAALLGVQLYREAKSGQPKPEQSAAVPVGSRALPGGETTPPAPTVIPVFMPQDRPGPADQGGPSVVYALPPGMTPQDVADYYASRGRAHDAGPVINIYQGGSLTQPDAPATGGPPPVSPSPDGGGVPLDGTAPTPPATPPPVAPTPPPAPPTDPVPQETHEDILGRKQPGPPSPTEVAGKAALGYGGGLVLEALGTAKIAADAARAGAGATAGRAAAGLAGPVAAGAGIGLQATQILQDVGFFDQVVKPAGEATGKALGETGSKAVATLALPLSLPGAVVKAAVTPGESVVGNLRTAVDASFLPDAGEAAKGATRAAQRKIEALAGDAWGGITSVASFGAGALGAGASKAKEVVTAAPAAVVSGAQSLGGQVASAAQTAVGEAGHKFNQGVAASQAVVGDLGHKFNQGREAVTGFFSKRWF